MRSVESRFWEKVDKDGPVHPVLLTRCWLWTGVMACGYGKLRIGTKIISAHRVAWLLSTGEWSTLNVLHNCDVPHCVRFDHLREGTQKENIQEAVRKGRFSGEHHGGVKLTNEDVLDIRRKAATGDYSQAHLAKFFGISQGRLSLIVNGKAWRHLL